MALCGATLARIRLVNKEERRILKKKNCHGQEIFQNCYQKITCVKTVNFSTAVLSPRIYPKMFPLQEIIYFINKNIMGRRDKQTNLTILPWSPRYKSSAQILSIRGFRAFKTVQKAFNTSGGIFPQRK